MIVYGSVFNSLPAAQFDAQRVFFGQEVRCSSISDLSELPALCSSRTVTSRRFGMRWPVRSTSTQRQHRATVSPFSKRWSPVLLNRSLTSVDRSSHRQQIIMDLAVVQIQALVKQTQYRYLMAFGLELAKPLVCPPERMETAENGNSDAETFPSFTLFQPNVKRVC